MGPSKDTDGKQFEHVVYGMFDVPEDPPGDEEQEEGDEGQQEGEGDQ